MKRALLWLVACGMAVASPSLPAQEPSFNGKSMTEWMTMLKEDSLARKRRAAVLALEQIMLEEKETADKVLPVLARTLRTDANTTVRQQVVAVLGRQPEDKAPYFFGELTELVRTESDSAVRRELAVTLGRYGKLSRGVAPSLVSYLDDPAADTRAATAEALGRIGTDAENALAKLTPLLEEEDRAVRLAAIFALGRITTEDPTPASAALVATATREQQRQDRLVAPAAVGSALALSQIRDARMLLEVLISLGLLGDRSENVVATVGRSLADGHVDLRRQAALVLGRFGPASRSLNEPLQESFRRDPDHWTRIYALNALQTTLGSDAPTLIPLMAQQLKADPDFEVRVAIAEALGGLGNAGKEAIPALREAQRDPQIKVREAALAAIKQIQKPPADPQSPPSDPAQ